MKSVSFNKINPLSFSFKFIYAALILIFSFFDIYISFFGLKLKIVYFLEIPLIIYIMLFFTFNRLKISKFLIYNFLWFFTYFLSITHIISLNDFLAVIIGQLVLFIVFIFFAYCLNDYEIYKIEDIFWKIVTVISAYGIIQLLIFYFFGLNFGISHFNDFIGLARPRSVLSEPDWYGLVCGIGTTNYFIKSSKNNFYKYKMSLLINLVGLFVSFTRATWVGTVIALLFYFVFYTNKKERKNIYVLCLVLLTFVSLCLVIVYFINYNYFLKISNRINPFKWLSHDGGATNTRTMSIKIMIHFIKQHPFSGNGVGSMNYIAQSDIPRELFGITWEINAGRGNANIFVTNMFDCGIFGEIFLILSIIYFINIMRHSYSKTHSIKFIVALFSYINMIIVFNFNNGYRIQYVWIFMAIYLKIAKIETCES